MYCFGNIPRGVFVNKVLKTRESQLAKSCECMISAMHHDDTVRTVTVIIKEGGAFLVSLIHSALIHNAVFENPLLFSYCGKQEFCQ